MNVDDAHPDELKLLLVLLRSLRSWTQTELALAAGTSPSVISEYESGKRRLSAKVLERLAGAAGFYPSRLPGMILELRSLRRSMKEHPGAEISRQEVLVEEVTRQLEPMAALLVNAILPPRPRQTTPPPAPEDRQAADDLWERLHDLTRTQRRVLVDAGADFQCWALCERLCEESFRKAEEDGREAQELAELAVRVAWRTSGERAWLSRLEAYAWAHVGHARRVRGDLEKAREAFSRFRTLWREGEGAAPGLLDEARVHELDEPEEPSGD